MSIRLTIVVPVLNEIRCLSKSRLLEYLVTLADVELIFVDGGSQDGTRGYIETKLKHVDVPYQVISSDAGRAKQMNAGAALSRGEVVLFLHADTRLPSHVEELVCLAMHQGSLWGRFDIMFHDVERQAWLMRLIAFMINQRSKLTGIATGDQAIFVDKSVFVKIGGFAEIALMEDIVLSKQLKSIVKPYCIKQKASTSARRWQQKGIIKTILFMWWLRFLYFLGVSPARLAKMYSVIR